MSKVSTIKIENLKAIGEFEANFKGCTGIVTASNNMGKTTFLRSIPDRIRFVRPEVMVKKGSNKGKGEMTLDSGERFVWEFTTDGKDTLHYFTKEGNKRNVTVELGEKFFPKPFDIDKFLQSTPKEQAKQLQKIVGIDFTDIDKRYAAAYQLRTDKNKDAEKFHVKLTEMMEVPKVAFIDTDNLQQQKEQERIRLNNLYISNKKSNDDARAKWNEECKQQSNAANKQNEKLQNDWTNEKLRLNEECNRHNELQRTLMEAHHRMTSGYATLHENGFADTEVQAFMNLVKDSIKADKNASELYPAEPNYVSALLPPEPTYIPEMPDDTRLKEIDDQIFQAVQTNTQAKAYKDYIEYKQNVEVAKTEALATNEAVKAIEQERKQLILSANFPKGIEITPDGITIDGLPLDRNQISTSKLYTAALRIAAMNLGEVKTLYFDASYLDKASLTEIQTWANEYDLQLLIERPSWEEQELHYELIENDTTPTPEAKITGELFGKAA